MNRYELGRYGEELVARLLERRGFRIVARNLHNRFGELDIVAVCEGVLHVVEVKTRRSARHGSAAEAIDKRKMQKVRRATWQAQRDGIFKSVGYQRVQFDVAAVYVEASGEKKVKLFWNIGTGS